MKCAACETQLPDEAAWCPQCGTRQDNGIVYEQYDYAAFISYRHRSPDQDVAIKLHRALESYRLPKRIAQSSGSRSVGRVFRDRDELRATGSLPQAIHEALKRSRSLIVVCSPATTESEWVNQEIENFVSYHGSERIIAVLAEGSSEESLPAILKADAPHVDSRANLAHPLAADMRKSAKSPFAREKLRVIAAVADCDFDDLARRSRKRRRRIWIASLASAACIIALLAVFGLGMRGALRESDLSEAEHLAAVSLGQSEAGRMREAQRSALAAADAAERAGGRDLVPEVHHALESASTLYPIGNTLWTPIDSRVAPGPLDTIAINGDASCYAAVDSNLSAVVYTSLSDEPLWTFPLPHDEGFGGDLNPANWKLTFHAQYLVAYNPSTDGSGKMACFDITTGETVLDTTAFADATCFAKGTPCGFFANVNPNTNELAIGRYDISTSKVKMACSPLALEGNYSQAPFIQSCADSETRAAFAIDSLIASVDSGNEKPSTVHAAKPYVSSLKWCNNALFVASYDVEQQTNQVRFDYVVEAFSPTLEKRWELKGNYSVALEGSLQDPSLADVTPQIALSTPDAASVYVCAGQKVLSAATGDGTATEVYQASRPLIEIGDMVYAGDRYVAHALDVDGGINILVATSPGSFTCPPEYQLQLPERCRTAKLGFSEYLGVLATAIPDSDEGRLHFHRTKFGESLSWSILKVEDEGGIEDGYCLFGYAAGGTRALGMRDDDSNRECLVFDAETLGPAGTMSLNELAGVKEGDNEIESMYTAKGFPDMRYFFLEGDDSESTLFAFDLATQTVTGSRELNLYSKESSGNADYPQLLSYATPYGGAIINMIRDPQGSYRNLRVTTVDPHTLDTLGEVEVSADMVPLAVWPLENCLFVARAGESGIGSPRGVVGLFDAEGGQPVQSDFDAHAPYELTSDNLSCVAVNDDATRAVMACDDDTLRCFNLPSGTCAWELPFEGRGARFLSFEYGGNRLFAQDEGGTCCFIDSETGQVTGKSDEALAEVQSGRFSTRGDRYFASYRESGAQVPSMCTLDNAAGRIGVSSNLYGVPLVSTDESTLLEYLTPDKAAIASYFTTDELYDFVQTLVEYRIDPAAAFAQAREIQKTA